MSLGKKVLKGSSWLLATKLIISGLSAINVLIMARLLTPEDFGLVALASVVTNMLLGMVQIPVGQAIIKLESPTKDHFNTAFTINVIRAASLALLLFVIALPMANFYDDDRVTMLVIVFALAILVSGFSNPKFVLFEKDMRFSYLFATGTLSRFLAITISISIAFYTRSYWALVIGSLITQLLNLSFTYWFLPYKPSFSLKEKGPLLRFSVWMSLSHIINNLNWRFDQLLVGKLFGTSTLGSYNLGNELASLPTQQAASPMMRVLFPAFSQIQNAPQRFRAAYLTSTSMMYSVVLPLGFGIGCLAEPIILITVGNEWRGAIMVMELIAGTMAISCLIGASKAVAMAKGETKLIFKRDVIYLIIKIAFLLVGYMLDGLFGLLVARAIANVVMLAINFQMVSYLLSITLKDQLFAISRPLISTAVMTICLWLLPIWNIDTSALPEAIGGLLISVAYGATLYTSTHFLCWWLLGKPEGIEQKLLSVVKKP